MADKETDLTYVSLKNMKKNDFEKLFKKPTNWKKAQAVLFLAKYKFANGKMPLVAIPFRKYNEAAKCFKDEIKKESTYSAKLTLLTSLEKKQNDQGNLVFEVTPMQGGMNIDYLDTYGKELFSKLKTGFRALGAKGKLDNEDIQEVVEAAGETLSAQKTNKLVAKRQKRAEKATKIQENLGKFEKVIGKVEASKLQEKLSLYKQVLSDLTVEAKEDGKIDAAEKQELYRMEQNIQHMEQLIENVEEVKSIVTNIQSILKDLQIA